MGVRRVFLGFDCGIGDGLLHLPDSFTDAHPCGVEQKLLARAVAADLDGPRL